MKKSRLGKAKGRGGKWRRYEREKRQIQNQALSPDEYEAQVKRIAKRCGV
jgi:hypothetical protein